MSVSLFSSRRGALRNKEARVSGSRFQPRQRMTRILLAVACSGQCRNRAGAAGQLKRMMRRRERKDGAEGATGRCKEAAAAAVPNTVARSEVESRQVVEA